ncbi:MAG: alpha-L-fucosidase [Acidobacteriota bacterium]|nr:alpha-L-fucosidase [Acidobacteriota bacterium]
MKTLKLLIIILALSLPAIAGPDPRLEQFNNWKFGLFIHWGPCSIAGWENSWPLMRPLSKRRPGDTEEYYATLAPKFNPVKFDADAWVKLAKDAGQRYIVFTTKHLDGFCMWDSLYTDYKITKTPYGKDIVKQLADSCQRADMPLGFYYSTADMHHPYYRDTSKIIGDNFRGEPWRPEWPIYLDYVGLQLTELLTHYGKTAVIWFDAVAPLEEFDGLRYSRLIHELQPNTLVNNRLAVGGDFDTPEQHSPKGVPTNKVAGNNLKVINDTVAGTVPKAEDFRPWETCQVITKRNWFYHEDDHTFKSVKELIQLLADTAGKGGNLLLDIGPGPDGTIRPEFTERLLAMGAWLKINGDSIYGTTYGPLQNLSFGRSTRNGKTIYLHVFDWPANGKLQVDGFSGHVTSAQLLAGGKRLTYHQNGDKLVIDTPQQAPDPNDSVLTVVTR